MGPVRLDPPDPQDLPHQAPSAADFRRHRRLIMLLQTCITQPPHNSHLRLRKLNHNLHPINSNRSRIASQTPTMGLMLVACLHLPRHLQLA